MISRFVFQLSKLRNIGISAHIDSGKTTLTERILYYTGRIDTIKEVHEGAATMDSMQLEREKGITIQSAATSVKWKDCDINIIDTPGHVDFTVEVERALRVLDGAILVVCAVGGVQSQTLTVNRQMNRYNIPRLVFINKLDRQGAKPMQIIDQIRDKLALPVAALQIPIGLEDQHEGVIDLIHKKAIYFTGEKGMKIITKDIPQNFSKEVNRFRQKLVESLADVDDIVAEKFLNDEIPTELEIENAIRNGVISRSFIPVFMGSAYKNKGVQVLLDGVDKYLPNPTEIENFALDISNNEEKVPLSIDSDAPFVGLAFKLEEGSYGQLTYIRVYQGKLAKGMNIFNVRNNKKIKVPRLVKMHSNKMEDVQEVQAGDICAVFGVDCASGDTFTDGNTSLALSTMFVPDPVISLSIEPKSRDSKFAKALQRFTKEDPTFSVRFDSESKETIISGMGELHLEIYIERMKREYGVECIVGKPKVAFRETISQKAEFNYTHKKQSGGSGQYGKVIGYIEPFTSEVPTEKLSFESKVIGGNIPTNFIPACEKGFLEAAGKGTLTGHPVQNVKFVLTDGQAHSVDSNELAFRSAALYAFRQIYEEAKPVVLEPIMKVSVEAPTEFQGNCISLLNRRFGNILNSDTNNHSVIIDANVPLNRMFGFASDLRSSTQGKGEFTMEFSCYEQAAGDVQKELVNNFKGNK
eukprot:NODE_339_length_9219_cov_0.924232.p2 type:complete len:695 gc:universal NODE_339_length_9219_cov_0.924232:4545-2461(-)